MKQWLLLLAFLTLGCTKSLPVLIHLDKTFSAEDRAIVLEAIAEWNDRAGPLLKSENNIFIVGDDVDTFHGSPELGDDTYGFYHVDIKFTPPNRAPGDDFGYTTLHDVLLFSDYIRQLYATIEADEQSINQRDPKRRERIVRHIIKKVSIHELGHLLGISHYFHREGIMVPGVPKSVTTIEGPHLSDADLEAFCILYDCK